MRKQFAALGIQSIQQYVITQVLVAKLLILYKALEPISGGPRAIRSHTRPIRTTSSCSNGEFGSFDLTDDDLEELDESVDLRPTGPQLKTVTEDRTLMPPPPLPPPPIAKVLPVRLQSGFTVAELEYFIDDDIQLTQVG